MTTSHIASFSAAATSVTISSIVAGDLLIAAGYNSGAATAPTLPPGWNSIQSNATNTNGITVGYKFAVGGETTSDVWTNATKVAVSQYRTSNYSIGTRLAIGGSGLSIGSSTTAVLPAFALQNTSGSSWLWGVIGSRTDTTLATAPTGMTTRTSLNPCLGVYDKNGGVTSWSGASKTVTNTGWCGCDVEIKEVPDTTAPTITSSATGKLVGDGVATFSQTLTANESVTWSKTGGADTSLFTLTGNVLTMAAKSYASPSDSDANNTYIVQVTATDLAGNVTNQTITVTVFVGTTWNPADQSTIQPSAYSTSVTNSGHTLYNQDGLNNGTIGCRVSDAFTGLKYIELNVDAWTDGNTALGTSSSADCVASNTPGTSADNSIGAASYGSIINNYTTLAGSAAWVSGNRLRIAVNATTRMFWIAVGAGYWNNSSTADPASGAGGAAIPGTTPIYLHWKFQGATLTDHVTLYDVASGWTYSAPTGFTGIHPPAAGGTTYNVVIAEAATAGESSTQALAVTVAQSEAATATEGSTTQLATVAVQTDTVSASESSSGALTAPVAMAEAVTAADASAGGLLATATAAESVTAAEVSATNVAINLVDAEASVATGTSSTQLAAVASASETVSSADASFGALLAPAVAAETATATDAALAGLLQASTATEPTTGAEAATGTIGPAASTSEPVNATDASVGQIGMLAARSEVAASTDAALSLLAAVAGQTESMTAGEASNGGSAAIGDQAEALTASEAAVRTLSAIAATSDPVSAAEALASGLLAAAASTEALTGIESAAAGLAMTALLSDPVTASAAQTAGLAQNGDRSETSTATDAQTSTHVFAVALAEILTALDSTLTITVFGVTATEAGLSVDLLISGLAASGTQSDAGLAAATAVAGGIVSVTEFETLAATESALYSLLLAAGLIEAGAAIEMAVPAYDGSVAITEGGAATSAITATLVKFIIPVSAHPIHLGGSSRRYTLVGEPEAIHLTGSSRRPLIGHKMRQDIALYIGETWTIDGVVKDCDGAAIDLTGGTIEFRISTPTDLLLKLISPGDIAIVAGVAGTYSIQLGADDARQIALAAGNYDYEVDAKTLSGAVSVQNTGKLSLRKSLRALFPGP